MRLVVSGMLLAIVCVSCFVGHEVGAAVQDQDEPRKVTSRQRQEARRIKVLIDRAGKQYQAGRFEDSAKTIQQARDRLENLVEEPFGELLKLVEPQHRRLEQAFRLLSEKGESMGSLDPLPTAPLREGEVLFTQTIAPILVEKCGRCHVNRARGDFSMASFQALMEASGVEPGKPDESRIVEMIESGEMPRGGLTIEEEELTALKLWISSGAQFDGDDPAAGLPTMVTTDEPEQEPLPVVRATGEETVSFSLHVAPMLIESCSGCHIEAQNTRGDLNMTTFRGLLNGGESGRVIRPGQGEASLLVKKLKGTAGGRRMPINRPPLEGEQIALISKWIDEGAKFDGRAARMNISRVNALARVAAMNHAELVAERTSNAKATWELVMSGIPANTVSSDEFLVIGDVDRDRLNEILELADSAAPEIKEELQIDSDEPLVKGRMTLFVFQRRYDYSEFGKMVESRDLPDHYASHWRHDTIRAYAALLTNPRQPFEPEAIRAKLTQQIAATAMRDQAADIPRWFANGVGYLTARKIFNRDDEVKSWVERAQKAAAAMRRPDDFVQQRIPEDQAGLVSYLFVGTLMQNDRQFIGLLEQIDQGISFTEVFANVFSAPPAKLIQAYYGQKER